MWFFRMPPSGRSVSRLAVVGLAGTILLIVLQIANNRFFDRILPNVKILDVPPQLDPR
jgi:hypothetical protein